MTCLLHTARLMLRPCDMSDLNAIHQLWTEPDVRRFLFDDRQISDEEARSFVEASLASFAQYGYGIWLSFEHNRNQIAGFSGLLHSPGNPPSLIFGTRPQYWGRGYAKEAANSILRYAFEVLELRQVVADVDKANMASIRVLEALGMTRRQNGVAEGTIAQKRPLLYYEIQFKTEE